MQPIVHPCRGCFLRHPFSPEARDEESKGEDVVFTCIVRQENASYHSRPMTAIMMTCATGAVVRHRVEYEVRLKEVLEFCWVVVAELPRCLSCPYRFSPQAPKSRVFEVREMADK